MKKKHINCFLIFVCLLAVSNTFGQTKEIKGCTDPFSKNFDPQATQSNECRYKKLIYNPSFQFELPTEVNETSGLFFYKGKLWTQNDSGGEPILYGIDTVTKKIVQEIHLLNIQNVDWEDVAIDDQYVYVGDFGNNLGNRKDLCIYKFPLSKISDETTINVEAEKISFVFDDQNDFTKRFGKNFDCEAFIATENSLYLFSKNWQDAETRLYQLPKDAGNYRAKVVGSFFCNGLITAADYNSETHTLVLLGYVNKVWQPFMWIIYDIENEDFISAPRQRVNLINLLTTQTEGICFVGKNELLISAEKSKTFSSRVFKANISKWSDKIQLARSGKEMKITSNIEKDKVTIHFDFSKIKKGSYRFDVLGSMNNTIYSTTKDFSKKNKVSIEISRKLLSEEVTLILFGKKHHYYTSFNLDD